MSTTSLEREIKLRFDSVEEARAAVLAAGARRCSAGGCRRTRCSTPRTSSCAGGGACCASASRTARAGSRSRGRCSRRSMKVREELETMVGDGEVLLRDLRGARAARLVPLREVSRGVLARGRDRRDRRNAGRRVRRDRRQRAGHRGDGRGARPHAGRLHRRFVPRPVPAAPRRVRPDRHPTWCSTPTPRC